QTAAMTDAAIAAEIHQPLDVHGGLSAQVAFDRQLADLRAQGGHFGFREILDQRVELYARGGAGFSRLRVAHAEDGGEPHPYVLVHRNVDAGDAGHADSLPATKARNFKLKSLENEADRG